jgi:hypothetical protein
MYVKLSLLECDMYIPAQFRLFHYNADCRDWVDRMPIPMPSPTAIATAAAAVILQ